MWSESRQFESVRFPRLTWISTKILDKKDEQLLSQFLQARLQTFRCAAGSISEIIAIQVEALGPSPQNILISKLPGTTTNWDLVRFLSGRLSLTSIRLRRGLEDVASDELYLALFNTRCGSFPQQSRKSRRSGRFKQMFRTLENTSFERAESMSCG